VRQAQSTDAFGAIEPPRDCPRCPRLAAYRQTARIAELDWFNAPVPTFGAADGDLLIVGLAPGLRGANRTGRPFTGDYAGDLLYGTLGDFGFAEGEYRADPADGLRLVNAAITNAVRCVPPENKPLPAEVECCRPFFASTLATRPGMRALLALGRIAHDQVLRTIGARIAAHPFAHGAVHEVIVEGRTVRLYDSYHCSRYNTNTRRLTPDMFRAVFERIVTDLRR
jgi:uracil-DNA glycosylase